MGHMPQIGCRKDELDTPALCLDLDKMDANVRSMMARCRRAGVAWRPHAKCHKSPAIARRLVEAGALGVTCGKLGEAEVMADGGVSDLLIANFIVGRSKIDRLVDLRRRSDVMVCVDHVDQVTALGCAMAVPALGCACWWNWTSVWNEPAWHPDSRPLSWRDERPTRAGWSWRV